MDKVRRALCTLLTLAVLVAAPLCIGAQALTAPTRPAGSTPTATPTSKPRIIVEGCAVEGGGLVSGAVCKVSITLRNTSASTEVLSVLVTGRWPSDATPPVDFKETNQAYVNGINPTETREVTLSLGVQPVNIAALDTVPMYLDIVYSYDHEMENTNTVLVQLPVNKATSGGFAPVEAEIVADGEPMPDRPLVSKAFIYASGSVLCAFAAGVFVLLRFRRR